MGRFTLEDLGLISLEEEEIESGRPMGRMVLITKSGREIAIVESDKFFHALSQVTWFFSDEMEVFIEVKEDLDGEDVGWQDILPFEV